MDTILVIGSLNIDFVVNVDAMPQKGETILGKSLELIPGGKGANQACACARLGCKTKMLGAVGTDSYGKMLLDNLRDSGVDVSHISQLDNVNTGIAVITVDQAGDNSITVVQGANTHVTVEMVKQNRSLIEACDILIMQLEIPLETVEYAAKLAKSLGKTVILDPAPAPMSLPQSLIEQVDIIKPNETELERISGISIEGSGIQKAADALKARGAKNVIVTLGGDGAFVCTADGVSMQVPSPAVEVVDTTAAGDAFTAALACRISSGDNLEDAVRFANAVGAVTVTRKGAQSSVPTIQMMEEFISRTYAGKSR